MEDPTEPNPVTREIIPGKKRSPISMYGPHPFVCGVQRYGHFPYRQTFHRFIFREMRKGLETRTIISGHAAKKKRAGIQKQKKREMVCPETRSLRHTSPFLRLSFVDPLSFYYSFIIPASGLVRDSFGPRRRPDNQTRRKDNQKTKNR